MKDEKMISLIIPTNRDITFLDEWKEEIENNYVEVIIVEDRPEVTLKLPKWLTDGKIYSHKAIDKDLGKDAWIIPKHSDGIRCYGFLKAEGDIIVTIDDDCYPTDGFFKKHLEILNTPRITAQFYNIYNYKAFQRGFPYGIRIPKEVVFNQGLWNYSQDLDAITELADVDVPKQHLIGVVHQGLLIPICIMNVAFKRELIPIYYQLPPHPNFTRMHDIWSGFILKKIIDATNKCLCVGEPYVNHIRKSNPYTNLIKEAHGIKANEIMWEIINDCNLSMCSDYISCYNKMISHLKDIRSIKRNKLNEFIIKCTKGMKIWLKLVKENETNNN